MNSNFSRKFKKLIAVFNNLHLITRKILKIGLTFFIIVFLSGITLFLYNYIVAEFNDNLYYTSISMIKASLTVLFEVVFGSLIIDYAIKRYEEDDD
jgi:hypothetical protein